MLVVLFVLVALGFLDLAGEFLAAELLVGFHARGVGDALLDDFGLGLLWLLNWLGRDVRRGKGLRRLVRGRAGGLLFYRSWAAFILEPDDKFFHSQSLKTKTGPGFAYPGPARSSRKELANGH